MLLGVGGLDIGALGEPGPGVLPGAQGAGATVEEVPGVVELAVVVLVVDRALVEVPAPLTLELLLVDGVVELPTELLAPGLEVEVLVLPTLVPLFAAVHGATVVVVPERSVVVPWFCVPSVPPVTLPGLPATPGVPEVTEGVPLEVVGVCVVVVPVCVPTPVLVAPG